jgi:predicted nucleic acid-binding protein
MLWSEPSVSRAGRRTSIFVADEFLLELAVAGRADAIVTHNVRDFLGADRFGIRALTPRDFLRTIIEEEET